MRFISFFLIFLVHLGCSSLQAKESELINDPIVKDEAIPPADLKSIKPFTSLFKAENFKSFLMSQSPNLMFIFAAVAAILISVSSFSMSLYGSVSGAPKEGDTNHQKEFLLVLSIQTILSENIKNVFSQIKDRMKKQSQSESELKTI